MTAFAFVGMKGFLCCVVVLLAAGCVSAMTQDIQDKCLREAGLTKDDLKDLHAPLKEISVKKQCFLGCIYESQNFWDNKEMVIERASETITDKAQKKIFEECYRRVEKSDNCKLGKDLFSCASEAGLV